MLAAHREQRPVYPSFVHRKRGGEASRSAASVLTDFGGRAIHDCLPAYYRFEQAKHGACLVHILRELQSLVEQGSAWAGGMHAFLWHLYEQARPLPGEAAVMARNRYRQIVSEAELAEPQPEQRADRGRPEAQRGAICCGG